MKKRYSLKTTYQRIALLFAICFVFTSASFAQGSVAHQWNECQLSCIRKYFAKPTVHARHLFHASVVMYDAWAVYDDNATPFFLGQTWGDFTCPFNGIPAPPDGDLVAAQEKAISYAMYRTLWNRYTIFAPGANLLTIQGYINAQMNALGYDPSITSTDYSDGDPAKLGNYIAAQMQLFALQDGSNQQNNYANLYYSPINGQIEPNLPGNPNVVDPNRWQSLVLAECIDQNGIPVECPPGSGAPALSPEWGNVVPFALTEDQSTIITRDGDNYKVYLDPGPPPYIDTTVAAGLYDSFFKWGYVMNIIWHSFHNNDDGVMVDASPNNIGGLNITSVDQLPETFEEFQSFYDLFNGGVYDPGHDINPVTGEPYPVQMVPRKDFSRVLSQYWADGPNSETPPGHWFKLFNDVSDHPQLEKRWMGEGEILSDLEWDVRGYFALGGGIHDAAVACWGAKGAYDSTRPIMAIRWMGDRGQCTDPNLPHYHPAGLPLIPGYIELVEEGDELAGPNNENVNKIKVYSWRGPVAATGVDGAGWLLSENWWTYQTAGFVTPPFPGYYSGHSTYSRTGAEIMTLITGDEYFPGGMAEYDAQADEYLLADDGPSVEVKLQWATYRDAADQCSVSRIYGGLHPPQDDIPGRRVGLIVGPQAFNKANAYMTTDPPRVDAFVLSTSQISDALAGNTLDVTITFDEEMNPAVTPDVNFLMGNPSATLAVANSAWSAGNTVYTISYAITDAQEDFDGVMLQVTGAEDLDGNQNIPGVSEILKIDMLNPSVSAHDLIANGDLINDFAVAAGNTITLNYEFSEEMDMNLEPQFSFPADDASATIVLDAALSNWTSPTAYTAVFNLVDANVEMDLVNLATIAATDNAGNEQIAYLIEDVCIIDTRNPSVSSSALSANLINDASTGSVFTVEFVFDEDMDQSFEPQVTFPENNDGGSLLHDAGNSGWTSANSYLASFFAIDADFEASGIDLASIEARDLNNNIQVAGTLVDELDIDTHNPEVLSVVASNQVIADAQAGGNFSLLITFDDEMDTSTEPVITLSGEGDEISISLTPSNTSGWQSSTEYLAIFDVADAGAETWNIVIESASGTDDAGNEQESTSVTYDAFSIDTRNPQLVLLSANSYNLTSANAGSNGFQLVLTYDEPMNDASAPVITFPTETPALTPNAGGSGWISPTTYVASYDVPNAPETLADIDVEVSAAAADEAGNTSSNAEYTDFFSINVIVSVNDLDPSYQFNVYPNPVNGGDNLYIQWNNIPTGLNVEVYDATGRMVRSSSNISAAEKRITLDTQGLTAGLYFVHVNTDAGNAVFGVNVTTAR